jgi:hypothetical protein
MPLSAGKHSKDKLASQLGDAKGAAFVPEF